MALTIVAFVAAYFFAFNIGASGSAAAMSVPYGSGDLNAGLQHFIFVQALF